MVSTYKNFLSAIKKEVLPVYLFCGSEEFLIDTALIQVKKLILSDEAADLNAHLFYGEDTNSGQIITEAQTLPFLSSKRLIIVRNPSKLEKSGIENIITYIQNPAEFSCLILVDPGIKANTKLYKTVVKEAMVVDVKPLRGREIDQWLISRVTRDKKKLEPGAGRLIRDRVGDKLRELDRAVQTICAYTGERDQITISDVDKVIGQTHLQNIFKLVDAVGAKKPDSALDVLRQLQIQGVRETHCLNMIVRQLRQIEKCRKGQEEKIPAAKLAGLLGVPPFIVHKIKAQAGNFTLSELKQGFKLLLEADTKIKTGVLTPNLVMECLLVKLCSISS